MEAPSFCFQPENIGHDQNLSKLWQIFFENFFLKVFNHYKVLLKSLKMSSFGKIM